MTDTDIAALKAKAEEMANWLEYRTRQDDEKFITLKEGAPDWVRNLVFEAHDDMFANDYSYQYVQDALEAIVETANQDDAIEYVENRTEVYNSEMVKWLASNLGRADYVDQAVEDFGYKDLYSALQFGIMLERRMVINVIWGGLERRLEKEAADRDEMEG